MAVFFNRPMLIKPDEDLRPQLNAGGDDSWYLAGNIDLDDREVGFLVHYVRYSGEDGIEDRGATFTLIDVTNKKYYLDEGPGISCNPLENGFDIKTSLFEWFGGMEEQKLDAVQKNGNALHLVMKPDVKMMMPYSGAGYFPTVDYTAKCYEYAFPCISLEGTVIVEGQEHVVKKGNAWLDREWGPMGPGASWCWMAIVLSNGDALSICDTKLTLNRIWANIVHHDGRFEFVDVEPIRVTGEKIWVSDISGTEFPAKWTVRIPTLDTELEVETAFEGQETIAIPRLEGVIHVKGNYNGEQVTGRGFLEFMEYQFDK